MRCPITYQQVDSGKYSIVGLHSLSSKLNSLNDIPLSLSEIHQEYLSRAGKMSIQGVQPKLSMKLNIKENQFEIVDIKGKFILPNKSSISAAPDCCGLINSCCISVVICC